VEKICGWNSFPLSPSPPLPPSLSLFFAPPVRKLQNTSGFREWKWIRVRVSEMEVERYRARARAGIHYSRINFGKYRRGFVARTPRINYTRAVQEVAFAFLVSVSATTAIVSALRAVMRSSEERRTRGVFS